MTGRSLGLRSGSYGSLLQLPHNGMLQHQNTLHVRKPSKAFLSSSREKERFLFCIFRHFSRRKVGMLLLVVLALLAFLSGFLTNNRDDASENTVDFHPTLLNKTNPSLSFFPRKEVVSHRNSTKKSSLTVCSEKNSQLPYAPSYASAALTTAFNGTLGHPCQHFALPPPPGDRRRIGPRPCPVCYVPVERAIARMPKFPSTSPGLHHLTYFREEDTTNMESHGVSDFGGFPSFKLRNDSFNIKESMTVHCGFVKGCRPGHQTGFDIDEPDLRELEEFHDVIVASAIFGNYDLIQQPKNISDLATKNVPFYMFVDEETEAYLKNNSILDSSKKIGIWRIIVVRNIPYTDSRRNGKIPKMLLHRLFPNVRYSVWIDGKLQLVVDPYQILERFLWRHNASFGISRHYSRFDVFEEAEANKVAGKYDNTSIDYQVNFYKREGLTSYTEAKLPITSDVPEGCVILREHIPITNLFSCLWFNEVDRFTPRDQISFSTVRDKIMARVNWSVNMFMDCERRNFVKQAYHKDLLERRANSKAAAIIDHPPALVHNNRIAKTPVRKTPKRGRGDKKYSSRRHRKVVAGARDKTSI